MPLLVRLLLTTGLVVGVLLGLAQPALAVPWGWPLAGEPEVLRRMDRLDSPYAAGHRGVDLGATEGSPVLAAGDGVVSYAGWVAGRPVVVVRHVELRTTYEPVVAAVSVGDRVAVGEVLGTLARGHPGCGVCLHWGLRRGEEYLDPLSLVGRGPVRLLPLHAPFHGDTRARPARGARVGGASAGAAVDGEPEARGGALALAVPVLGLTALALAPVVAKRRAL